MERNGCGSSVNVPELFVGPTLANFHKAECMEDADNFLRFEYRNGTHFLCDYDLLCAYELGFMCK